ncbi:MAG: M20/M25/M40 family metallo-hydrolase, partial [Arenicella sp.]|nr:M20/M25/M40 family metallo-hydrolase [Arenicella sp.]
MKLLVTQIVGALFILLLSAQVADAAMPQDSEHAKKTLEIYTKVISIETVQGKGNVPKMAHYLADQFHQAGFNSKDVQVIEKDGLASLIVRYRGDNSTNTKPILLIGHMDVVNALPEDWQRPPFELTKDDKYFYGRGSIDNKLGVSMVSSTFIRLRKEGFVPTRDLIIAFSGDEETGMITTRMLANDM